MSDVIVETPVTQVVTGSVVADGETTPCSARGCQLRDGDSVVVYACRCVESGQWQLPQLWCQVCAPETLVTRTLGVVEALVTGRLCLRTDGSTQQTAVVVVGEGSLALSATTSGAGR